MPPASLDFSNPCHDFNIYGIEYLVNLSMEDKKRVFFNFNLRFSELDEILKQNNNSEKIGKIIQINIISSMGYAFKKRYLDSWHSDGQKNLYNISLKHDTDPSKMKLIPRKSQIKQNFFMKKIFLVKSKNFWINPFHFKFPTKKIFGEFLLYKVLFFM